MIDFLTDFRFHPDQPGLRSDHVIGWLRTAALDSRWNVVVRGTSRPLRFKDGTVVDLGTVDLGLDDLVPMVNRAPLARPDAASGVANIKALLSQSDWLADLDPELVRDLGPHRNQNEYQESRRQHAGDNGLLVIYVVSPRSVPVRETQAGARREMASEVPLIGLGLIFPEGDPARTVVDADYYSVRPDWTATMDEEVDIPADSEGFASIDAKDVLRDGSS